MALKRWAIANFGTGGTGSTQTLMTAEDTKKIIILSLLISNYSDAEDANIVVDHTDGTDTLFKFNIALPQGNSPMAIDSKIVLEPGDVIQVTSDIDEVSVIASGDES